MISSPHNARFKQARRLVSKNPTGNFFLIENDHLIAEATRRGLVTEIFTTAADQAGVLISSDLMRQLSDMPSLPRRVAVARKPTPVKTLGARVLVLDNVQDPGNVGTLIRTAAALSWTSVLVCGANPYGPKAVRASQGALFQVNVIVTCDPLALLPHHVLVGAEISSAALSYTAWQPPAKLALVLGNEGQGLSPALRAAVQTFVQIPVAFESLNVAAAGAILLAAYRLA